jgi:hypothetical protein
MFPGLAQNPFEKQQVAACRFSKEFYIKYGKFF